jgi:4-nitrophenyl phosphatase
MLPSTVTTLILDMDGVLWRDATPIGNLPLIFARIRDRGLKFAFATNNSTKTINGFLEIMANFGVELEEWQIITSSLATAEIMAREYPEGGPVFVIGESGIMTALEQKKFHPTTDAHEESRPVAVVAGFDRHCSYDKLRRAALLIRSGVPFFGTNPDKTFPSPEGLVPGAGALQAAITAATDVEPRVIGKPSPYLMHIALERLGSKPSETLVIGDRLETDITAGQAAGCHTALVLSGVSTRAQAEIWSPAPDIISDDLSTLIG